MPGLLVVLLVVVGLPVGVSPAAAADVNVALVASSVVASSENVATGQVAGKVVDGSAVGYPVDYSREWASLGERGGASVTLSWDEPVVLTRVVLFDRPNVLDQVTGGSLVFSDGPSVPVGELANDGTGLVVGFSERTVTSVRLDIASASSSTVNVGLAEFEAWGSSTAVGNKAPVADAGADVVVSGGALVTLDGSGSSDPDGNPLGFVWSQVSGTGVVLSDATAGSPSFTAPAGPATLVFELVVNDGTVDSPADTVTVTVGTVTEVNVARTAAPVVTASSEDTGEGSLAVRVVDGSYLGYPTDPTKEWSSAGQGAGAWIQLTWPRPVLVTRVVLYDRPNTNDQVTGGSLVFSSGANVSTGSLVNTGATTITLPTPRVTTSLRLNVTSVSTATENVGLAEFEVFGVASPVANAGADQQVAIGATVSLDGSGSTPGVAYAWTQTGGPSVVLSGENTLTPSFTASAAGTYVFQLAARVGVLSSTDTVTVIVRDPALNRAPVADAGADGTGVVGVPVNLSGVGSDPDGDPVSYAWSQTAGAAVTVQNASSAVASFVAPASGSYGFQLLVSDGLASATDTVVVTVSAAGVLSVVDSGTSPRCVGRRTTRTRIRASRCSCRCCPS